MEHWENLTLQPLITEFEGEIYTEEWKDIQGYEKKYKVSSFGRVMSCAKIWISGKNGRIKKYHPDLILRQSKNKYGYHYINLLTHGKNKKKTIHTLVAIHFIDNYFNKPFVNHTKGVKSNNIYLNLEWCTQSENEKHAYKSGLKRKKQGELNGCSKLTENEVINIRKEFSTGKYTHAELGKIYNTSRENIGDIVRGQRWKHLLNQS
jgi:hypothetical protein